MPISTARASCAWSRRGAARPTRSSLTRAQRAMTSSSTTRERLVGIDTRRPGRPLRRARRAAGSRLRTLRPPSPCQGEECQGALSGARFLPGVRQRRREPRRPASTAAAVVLGGQAVSEGSGRGSRVGGRVVVRVRVNRAGRVSLERTREGRQADANRRQGLEARPQGRHRELAAEAVPLRSARAGAQGQAEREAGREVRGGEGGQDLDGAAAPSRPSGERRAAVQADWDDGRFVSRARALGGCLPCIGPRRWAPRPHGPSSACALFDGGTFGPPPPGDDATRTCRALPTRRRAATRTRRGRRSR